LSSTLPQILENFNQVNDSMQCIHMLGNELFGDLKYTLKAESRVLQHPGIYPGW
jgi:hypothetical protein